LGPAQVRINVVADDCAQVQPPSANRGEVRFGERGCWFNLKLVALVETHRETAALEVDRARD
jgi:hypothetical protein